MSDVPKPAKLTPEEMRQAAEEGRDLAAAFHEHTRGMEGLPDPHAEADHWRHRAESAELRAQRAERVIEAARDLTFCCDHPGASCRAWCSMCQLEHGRVEALHAALTAYDQEKSDEGDRGE